MKTPASLAAEADLENLAVLDRLSKLAVGRTSLGKFYEINLFSTRDNLAIAGALALIKSGQIQETSRDRILELCKFTCVRQAAYDHFMATYEHDLVGKIVAVPPSGTETSGSLCQRLLEATYAQDHERLIELHSLQFKETGDLSHISLMRQSQEVVGGWQASLSTAVDHVLMDPDNGSLAYYLCTSLRAANQQPLLEYVVRLFSDNGIFVQVQYIMRAGLLLATGDAAQALQMIRNVNPASLPKSVKPEVAHLRAEILETLGRSKEAYKAYCEQNAFLRQSQFDQPAYFKRLRHANGLPHFDLGDDPCPHAFMMVGFPRSGTTLLEKALSAHPEIETFEEIPALSSMMILALHAMRTNTPWSAKPASAARKKYYDEIERHRQRSHARVLIDKLPVMSAYAPFLKGIFPNKKFIFSIRDPRDVVLSCIKQTFKPNSAMDNFTTLAEACRFYDFVMEQWFSVRGYPDANVCYVRYEDVVNDFKPTMTRVLQFAGLEWDEDVDNFSELAQKARVKTPSYQKVRSGLTLGVQSSWQKYDFLFASKDAAPLNKWIKFWGYAA